MELNEIISHNLIELRKKNKLTQMELAEKLNFSNKSISKWESGEAVPSVEVLQKMATLYNVKLDYFVNITHDESDVKHEEEKKPKHTNRYIYNRLTISLLCICVVWIVATYMFVISPTLFAPTFLPFVWSLPLSFLMAVIFNSIWGKPEHTFWYLSFLNWTLITSLFFTIPNYFWQIYFLGIPIQIVILLCANLVLNNKKNDPATIHEKRKFILFKNKKKREKKNRKKLEEETLSQEQNTEENQTKKA